MLFAILMLTVLVVAFASLHALYRVSDLEGEEKSEYFWQMDLYTMTVMATIYFIWNVSFGVLAFYKVRIQYLQELVLFNDFKDHVPNRYL